MHTYIETYNAYSLDPEFSQQSTGCEVSHKIHNIKILYFTWCSI